MQKCIPLSFLLSIFFSCPAAAQDYFQQEVNMTIRVQLDDTKNELLADERIDYVNNSPNVLHEIYMHIWPNAYKDNSTALARQMRESGNTKLWYAKPEERGYIDQLDFKVNGEKVQWVYDSAHIDICKIILSQPLKPGEKISITTPFRVKIPDGIFSRLGHVGQSYMITQWYPKPAVYDKRGWNAMPYLNQGEFYSEFGSFDVHITLPKNYVLGATGDLVDGEKELEWLNQKAKETQALSSFSRDMAFPVSEKETKTLHFRQSKVHDFAWFADKRYHVLKGEVTLPHSKRKVTTWAMFTNDNPSLWKKSIEYINDAVYYYSLWNGDYPYNHATAVDGTISAGGGMEYPNITVIGSARDAFTLEIVIVHEVGHNWFYGILGSNERMHGWMDEGINSFYEMRYTFAKYPPEKYRGLSLIGDMSNDPLLGLNKMTYKTMQELTYLTTAREDRDQPVEYPSLCYTGENYGGIVYSKTALIFDYLRAYLGDNLFDKCMQAYYEQWKFKHPQPEDIRKVFEEVSGKKLDWFFGDIVPTTRKLDYKICSFNRKEQTLRIRNKGGIAGPFSVSALRNDSVVSTVWYEGFAGRQSLKFSADRYDRIRIDAQEYLPEINRQNNTLKARGLCKHSEPLSLHFLGHIEKADRMQVFWSPIAGYNNYDKFMMGIAFYNRLLVPRQFEYMLAPMYSFKTGYPAGYASFTYHWYPGKIFRCVDATVKSSSFAYNAASAVLNFYRVVPELRAELQKNDMRNPFTHSFSARSINIVKERALYSVLNEKYKKYNDSYYINEITYGMEYAKATGHSSLSATLQQGDKFVKGQAELNCVFRYPNKKKGVQFRVFAGKFLQKTTNGLYHFRMSGWQGVQDYLYDDIFIGRSEYSGWMSQQMIEKDGGFKMYTAFGRSNNWLASANLKVEHPGILPIGLYVDAGAYSDNNPNTFFTENALFDAGIYFPIVRNVCEIYLPGFLAVPMKDYFHLNRISFSEQIRFALNLKFSVSDLTKLVQP